MALNQELHIEKHYYTIGEVAQLFKVSTSLLRYWEKEFRQIKPQKTKQGIRKYSQTDINALRIIYDLVKRQGYTIKGAKEVLKNNKVKTVQEMVLGLKELKSFLLALEKRI